MRYKYEDKRLRVCENHFTKSNIPSDLSKNFNSDLVRYGISKSKARRENASVVYNVFIIGYCVALKVCKLTFKV